MREGKSIVQLARDLRKRQTKEEGILWDELRNRRLGNFKFSRQYPIIYYNLNNKQFFFIADFFCSEKKLVVELDGKIHDFQKDYDNQKETVIKELGLSVLRIKNEELINMPAVKEKIMKNLLA